MKRTSSILEWEMHHHREEVADDEASSFPDIIDGHREEDFDSHLRFVPSRGGRGGDRVSSTTVAAAAASPALASLNGRPAATYYPPYPQHDYRLPSGLVATPTSSKSTRVGPAAAAAPLAEADPSAMMHRLNELTSLVATLRSTLSERDKTLAKYHAAIGPLDEFCTVQVQLREEIVSLRDTVRMWQEKESAARAQVKALERVLQGIRQTTDFDTPETRLADLQDRLSHAYLHRATILEDIKKAGELFRAYEAQGSVMGSDGSTHAGDHLQWKSRGKLADLELQLKQKEELIRSLQAAADGLSSVMATSAQKDRIGETNKKCPGCLKPQWTSPYCPITGHAHAGCGQLPQGAEQKLGASSPNYGSLQSLEEEALASGEWRKLVQVGSFAVSYQHTPTGKIVHDLRRELLEMREQQRVKVMQEQQKQQMNSDIDGGELAKQKEVVAKAVAASSTPHHSDMSKEIALLVRTLEERNEQIKKLKGLLRSVAQSGMVGSARPPASAATGGGTPAAAPAPTQQAKEDEIVPLPKLGPLVGLGAEDEGMTETIRQRLENENALLNRRCTELILQLSSANDKTLALEAEVQRLRFQDDQRGNEHELRGQLQLLRDELLRERRRSLRMKEELNALTDRSNRR